MQSGCFVVVLTGKPDIQVVSLQIAVWILVDNGFSKRLVFCRPDNLARFVGDNVWRAEVIRVYVADVVRSLLCVGRDQPDCVRCQESPRQTGIVIIT